MGRQRNAAEVARDRKRIAQLYLKSWLQADIADELKIDQSTVSRDLKALHKLWLDDANVTFDEARSRELAKIDNLELTYWEAWQRSTENIAIETSKPQSGDLRFLHGVQWCINRRSKLRGLDEPQKLEYSGAVVSRLVILPPPADDD